MLLLVALVVASATLSGTGCTGEDARGEGSATGRADASSQGPLSDAGEASGGDGGSGGKGGGSGGSGGSGGRSGSGSGGTGGGIGDTGGTMSDASLDASMDATTVADANRAPDADEDGDVDGGDDPMSTPTCDVSGTDWACGGDPTGVWEVVGACGDLDFLAHVSRPAYYANYDPSCDAHTTTVEASTCGSMTFTAGGALTLDFRVEWTVTDSAPHACLMAPLTCDPAATNELEITNTGSTCRIRWGDDEHYSGQSGYTTDPGYLMFDDPDALSLPPAAIHCVDGDLLHFGVPIDMAGTKFMVFVARRVASAVTCP